jgi:competence transcription factor ComK
MEKANILISRIANLHDGDVELPEVAETLSSAIEAQSNYVRDIKASKLSREKIVGEVNKLLELKAQYREATGSDYRSSVRRSMRMKFYTSNVPAEVVVATEPFELFDPPLEVYYFTAFITENIYLSLVGVADFAKRKVTADRIKVIFRDKSLFLISLSTPTTDNF